MGIVGKQKDHLGILESVKSRVIEERVGKGSDVGLFPYSHNN